MVKAMWAVAAAVAAAQAPMRLTGDWQARAGDEIRHIMVRSDSSAQFGQDVARWRVVGDSLWITLGDGVWQVYGMKLAGEKLTISGVRIRRRRINARGDYFNSVTAANRHPTSFFSNRIANRRRSTRGAPPRAGTYWNMARTLPVAVAPCSLKSSIVNFAVI